MKSCCKLILLVMLMVVFAVAAAFGADPVAIAPAAVAPAAPSILAWFIANQAYVFAACLAVSEMLSLIPGFKGNGILDTIIKALVQLSGKATA
jgi:hypothetical protein